ncbi:hypothetical protein P375_11245 [Gallibacterium genomosp. 2]|uniref:Uncharacterized protein n=1 Tax=Gallibacterium genomosp. 2 TaxID=155517 RepID=A0A0A2XH81_9PAST|nr:hypothetical protein [Gallibacterium genomosp. 2]KGQ30015.1 hypothetical protein P375_11245 [Gallibacterium genomosp. 2]
MMDIFEQLNQQAKQLNRQRLEILFHQLTLALHQYKTDPQWNNYFTELLAHYEYNDIVNAIHHLPIDEQEREGLLHLLEINQFHLVQENEIADHRTFNQFK